MAKSEADLEVELAEAKEEYRGNPDDDKAKKRLGKAKQAIVEARRERREAAGVTGVTVGGDAVQGDAQAAIDQRTADLKAGIDPDAAADARRGSEG